jgi:hypothetical protein
MVMTRDKKYKIFGVSITNKKLQEKFLQLQKKQQLSKTVQKVLCAFYNIEEET